MHTIKKVFEICIDLKSIAGSPIVYKGCSSFALTIAVLLGTSGELARAMSRANPGAPPTPVTISGRVVNTQGAPVENARMTLYQILYTGMLFRFGPERLDDKSTGADGRFTLTASRGFDPMKVVYVVARKEGLSLGWTTWRRVGKEYLEITLSESKDLSGEVVDEKGQLVPEAEVHIAEIMMSKGGSRRFAATPHFLRIKTDGQGRFLFANMPVEATFEFFVVKPGWATLSTCDRTIDDGFQFAPGQADIKLILHREARIEGIVVEKTGSKPVGGMTVAALPESRVGITLFPLAVTTAQDGTFQIGSLTAGAYVVQLSGSSERRTAWVAQPVRVTVGAGETKTDVKLELTHGGIIEVLVTDRGGQPVADAAVTVYRLPDHEDLGGQTDEKGLARIRVAPGQYLFAEAIKEGYARRRGMLRSSDVITVEESETKRIEYCLDP